MFYWFVMPGVCRAESQELHTRMSRRTVFAAIVLAASAALTLSACSGSATPESSAAGDDLGLVDAGTLTVATEGTYRPFSFHDESGELVGFDVEIAEAVAEKLGLEIVVPGDPVGRDLRRPRSRPLRRHRATRSRSTRSARRSTSSASRTPSRPASSSSSRTTTRSPSFDDLAGKTTAQSLTSNWYELAQESGATVEAVEGWAQAVALLEQGRVDATINDKLTFLDYETTEGPTGLKIAAETDDPASSAFAFTQDKQALVEAIDDALAELREEGTLAEISEKYFGDDVTS